VVLEKESTSGENETANATSVAVPR